MTKIRKKPWRTAAGWLHAVLLLAGVYPFFAREAGLHGRSAVGFCALSAVLLFPSALSWLLFKRTKELWQFVLGAVAVTALSGGIARAVCPLLCGSQPNGSGVFGEAAAAEALALFAAVITAALSVVIFAIRASVRIKKGKIRKEFAELPAGSVPLLSEEDWEIPTMLEEPHPLQWIWFGIQYVLGLVMKAPLYWHMVFYLLFADIFLCLLIRYTGRVQEFIGEHRKIANLPAETMQKVSRVILLLACLLLLAALLPSALYGREPLADLMDHVNLSGGPVEMPEQETVQQSDPQSDVLQALKEGDYTPPPKWLMILLDLVAYALVLAVAAAVLRAVYQACRNVGRSFSQETEDEILFLEKEKKEERSFLRRGKRDGEKDLSASRKIRKRYKKVIRGGAKATFHGSETPTELEEKAGLAGKEEITLLHGYYEKARYSREGCTREEAELVLRAPRRNR